ncbi:hypothetical protein NAMH_0388 [Nautilia profundicola AmH]|uniref:Uncharacterized protein n=1 Tax=Nautilia profundicola (strain ATCC BAA-1463 / DSM 18972 / AmH) TaxID=598659 RepID=B9L853_NAUPA|nr:hypothetical protein [Nautilia profundicola]ACM92525.1 hypothetical protein NAMH_0388 [Nautilia profundicola AmH]
MKKIFSLSILVIFAFAFNVNQTYTCETLGLSFKENNKTYNIPNNEKTKAQLQKTLKALYAVKIKPQDKSLVIYVDNKSDTLDFVKMVDNKVPLYKTKASDLFILTDPKSSQIGISIPAQKMIIYYQCK